MSKKNSLSVCVQLMFYALVHVSFCLLKNSWCIYCWDQSIGHTREIGIIASSLLLFGWTCEIWRINLANHIFSTWLGQEGLWLPNQGGWLHLLGALFSFFESTTCPLTFVCLMVVLFYMCAANEGLSQHKEVRLPFSLGGCSYTHWPNSPKCAWNGKITHNYVVCFLMQRVSYICYGW